MADKKHINVEMGMKNPPASIEISASGEVAPGAAIYQQWWERFNYPGYQKKWLDSNLNPIYLYIKAGTDGQITIDVSVDYDYWEMEEKGGMDLGIVSFPGKKMPVNETGTVSCSATWTYKCSTTGELTIANLVTKDSLVSDNFSVKVNGFMAGNFAYAVLSIRPKYKESYVGQALELKAYLKITDVPPPPPPKADPVLAPLSVIIPFGKEGQTNLEDKARKLAADWAATLFRVNPGLEQPMMRGEIPVYFVGKASKTGKIGAKTDQESDDFDVDIGNARAQAVVKYLVPSPLGSGAKTFYKSIGRQQAQWGTVYDEKLHKTVEVVGNPRAIDRVVIVWVEKDDVLKIVKK